MVPNLFKKYQEEAIPKMKEKFGIKNAMALPHLEKIVVNMGVGDAIGDMKILDSAMADLAGVTGQKPMLTRAKKPYPTSNYVKTYPSDVK